MNTQFNSYLQQYEMAESLEQKQLLATEFSAFYDSLSSEEQQAMNQTMHPSLLELKAWVVCELDPLLTRAEKLLSKSVAT